MGLLYPLPSLKSACSIWASMNGHWDEEETFYNLKRCFLGVMEGESWAPMEILRVERNTGTEKCTPRRPHLGSRRSHCSRTTHHWRRDYSCPASRGQAEWHHGSANLAPSTAVLCPAGSLWDLRGGCRSHPLWCLLPLFQPWGRRDMGTETWKVILLITPPLVFITSPFPAF